MQNLSQDRIAQLAYQLWHQRGCPAGSPEVDWDQAVQLLGNEPEAGNNEVLSLPMATSQQGGGQPAPDDATSADGTTAGAAPIGGGASTPRSRGKGRTLRRSPI